MEAIGEARWVRIRGSGEGHRSKQGRVEARAWQAGRGSYPKVEGLGRHVARGRLSRLLLFHILFCQRRPSHEKAAADVDASMVPELVAHVKRGAARVCRHAGVCASLDQVPQDFEMPLESQPQRKISEGYVSKAVIEREREEARIEAKDEP